MKRSSEVNVFWSLFNFPTLCSSLWNESTGRKLTGNPSLWAGRRGGSSQGATYQPKDVEDWQADKGNGGSRLKIGHM